MTISDDAGKTHKLLHNRPSTELAWIAALLSDHNLSYNTPEAPEGEPADAPDPGVT